MISFKVALMLISTASAMELQQDTVVGPDAQSTNVIFYHDGHRPCIEWTDAAGRRQSAEWSAVYPNKNFTLEQIKRNFKLNAAKLHSRVRNGGNSLGVRAQQFLHDNPRTKHALGFASGALLTAAFPQVVVAGGAKLLLGKGAMAAAATSTPGITTIGGGVGMAGANAAALDHKNPKQHWRIRQKMADAAVTVPVIAAAAAGALAQPVALAAGTCLAGIACAEVPAHEAPARAPVKVIENERQIDNSLTGLSHRTDNELSTRSTFEYLCGPIQCDHAATQEEATLLNLENNLQLAIKEERYEECVDLKKKIIDLKKNILKEKLGDGPAREPQLGDVQLVDSPRSSLETFREPQLENAPARRRDVSPIRPVTA